MNWINLLDFEAERYRLECNMHKMAMQLDDVFNGPTHWTVACGLTNFREVIERDMQRLSKHPANPLQLTVHEQLLESIIREDVNDIKHRLLDRVMPNSVHTATRWPLGSLNRHHYDYWIGGLGFITYTTRSREVRELAGRCITDPVVHHHFNTTMLDSIPFFGEHWWEQEFFDLYGRRMKYMVTDVCPLSSRYLPGPN